MLEALVFEVELHFMLAFVSFDDVEIDLYCSFRNRFDSFWLTEFDLVAENVSYLVEEEHLDDVDFTPVIDDILNNYFAALFC